MVACISDVLSPEDLDRIDQAVQSGKFVDGRETAGWAARGIKRNMQMGQSAGRADALSIVLERMRSNELVQAIALPELWHPPLISRTREGMGYGSHTDDAFMGTTLLRTDLSYTLFLKPPESYDGGELVLESPMGESTFKLPAGAAVLYPSNFIHRVNTVTSGERVVACGWIKSLCPDPSHRELLFDLYRVRKSTFETEGNSDDFNILSKLYSNLLRLFNT